MSHQSNANTIVEIFDAESKRVTYGNGFIVHKDKEVAYVLTCAHIVKDAKGNKNYTMKVGERKAKLILSDESFDLALLRVPGLQGNSIPLHYIANAEYGGIILGFELYQKPDTFGEVVLDVKLTARNMLSSGYKFRAWALKVLSEESLVPGLSGSSVTNQNTGQVIGVVSHREGIGKKGLAIAIENLKHIWKDMPPELWENLEKAGPRSKKSANNKYNNIKQTMVMIGTSTAELSEHCETVQEVIWRSRLYPLTNDDMDTTLTRSLETVEKADVYIGLVGLNYGHIPQDSERNPNQLSLFELEYRRALEQDIPVLIFMVGEEHQFSVRDIDQSEESEAKQKLENLKREIIQHRKVWHFDSVKDLERQILPEIEGLVTFDVADSLDKVKESKDNSPGQFHSITALPDLYSVPPYILTNKFIGREQELDKLDSWATSDQPIMVIEAIGGVGKSALTWDWVKNHARDIIAPAGIIWWSFDERGATVESFIRHALAYITQQNPETLKEMPYQEQVRTLLVNLQRSNFLLVMDGLERILVAYHRIDRAHIRDHQVKDDVDLRNCTDPRDADFLRQLASLDKSKVLISTRLVPTVLEDAGMPILGVCIECLRGLTLKDARVLMFDRGVKKANRATLDGFLESIGYHSLLIKIVAGHIKEYHPAPGDFDQWYQQCGVEMDMIELAVDDRRTHILKYAIEGLEESTKLILSRIAAFSDPIRYRTLSIFNPYLPAKPSPPDIPPLPQTMPSPFGTPQLAWLKYQRSKTKIVEQQERLDAEIQHQEAIDAKTAEDMIHRRAELEAQAESVKKQRHLLMRAFEKSWQSSKEYLDGLNDFHSALSELEDRGLLQWDRENNSYDLHPVVRGYAFSLLPEEERVTTFGKIRDHFAGIPIVSDDQVNRVEDLQDMVDAYRALVSTGEVEYAAAYYRAYLGRSLRRLGAPYLIVELLKPLFLEGLEAYPPLHNVENQGYVINDLALSFKDIGEIDKARILFSLNLKSEHVGTRWAKNVDISNYSSILLELNRVADAFHASEFAAKVIDQENMGWVYLAFFDNCTRNGQWAEAQRYYDLCIAASRPVQYAQQFESKVSYLYAILQICQHQATDEMLKATLETIEHNKQARHREPLFTWWAEHCLLTNRSAKARQYINEAINLAQQAGHCISLHFSILARIEAIQGNKKEATRRLARALADPRLTEGGKADVYANIAQTYLKLQDADEAQDYALQAYKYAWADGEPYICFWPLDKARKVLDALGVPHPDLPPFAPSTLDKIPYEDEIRQAYTESGNLASLAKKSKKQVDFEMTRFTWVQVGTVSFFGVNDDDVINRIAHKFSSLSYIPTPVRFSRMGEDTPEPSSFQIDIERQQFDEIDFTFDELRNLDKTFPIVYVESFNSAGEKVHAYMNVRGDRLEKLLDQGETDEPFNIGDYATIVSTGQGQPTLEDREKLQREYLFGEHSMNVRIFPPLSEVT